MKTHRGAAKRFKRTGSGKVMHKKAGMRHIQRSKTKRRKRRLNIPATVTGGNLKKVERLLPK
ncbi:MAG: 50S ribosomal protein L35 [bacterium]